MVSPDLGTLEDAAETIFRIAHNLSRQPPNDRANASACVAVLTCAERLARAGWVWTGENVEQTSSTALGTRGAAFGGSA